MTNLKRGDRVVVSSPLADNVGSVGTVVQVDSGTSLVHMDEENLSWWYFDHALKLLEEGKES